MNFYETTFIVRQDLAVSQVEQLSELFSKIITDKDGKISKIEYWGLRDLAYPIKKFSKGHYVMMEFQSSADAVNEINRVASIKEDILRNIVFRIEAPSEGSSYMMRGEDKIAGIEEEIIIDVDDKVILIDETL